MSRKLNRDDSHIRGGQCPQQRCLVRVPSQRGHHLLSKDGAMVTEAASAIPVRDSRTAAGGKLLRCARLITIRAAVPIAIALSSKRTRRADIMLPYAALLCWMVAELAAEDDDANTVAAAAAQDAGTRSALVGTHLLAWWAPAVLGRRSRGSITATAVGTILVAIGGSLRVLAIKSLGNRFTGHVCVRAGHQIRDDGIYARMRHPSYLGLLMLNTGPALSCGADTAALGTLAASAAAVARRVELEERLLADRLGAVYDEYAARTPRYIPSFGSALRRPGRGRHALP